MNIFELHTFVLATFKDSPYLDYCIESLLNQTIKSSIIISTSTPTENVKRIANKHKIEMYVHNTGGSIGKDWNYGISIPKTKYVTIAHQDDIYCPNFLENNLTKLEKQSNSVLAFTNYREIDEKGSLICKNKNLRIKELMLVPLRIANGTRFVRDRVLSMGTPICCPSVTYNMHKLNNFYFSDRVSATVDWEAFSRISRIKGRWHYTSETLMYHRIHQESETSVAIMDNERTKEELEMFKKYWPSIIAKGLSKQYAKAQKTNTKR